MIGAIPLRYRYRAACIAFALIAHPTVASAQTSPSEKAAAEALFDEGLTLMRSGDFLEACRKLEQSQNIDRGIGTMMYLAECYEKAGRTASAWALFREASSEANAAGQTERAAVARSRAERLEPILSHLTIDVAPESRIEGLELSRNGSPIPRALWSVSLPVDPGDHVVEARAPGHTPWTYTVRVEGNAALATVSVPLLATDKNAPASAPPQPAVTAEPQQAAGPQDVVEPTGAGSTQRIIGIVIGSVGVVGLGVGGYFGVRAIGKNDDAEEFCPGGGRSCNDPAGVRLTEDAKDAATLSNIFMIGGGVLAAAGIAVYLTAPSDSAPVVSVRADGESARLVMGGAF